MKVVFITDTHFRGDEGFYQAGRDFSYWFHLELQNIQEKFVLIHGGDVFHRSQDNGITNGMVRNFFQSLCSLPLCEKIYVVEGNHDKKKETGSALDMLIGLDPKLEIVSYPRVLKIDDKFVYCLPHITPTMGTDITIYNNREYHDNIFSYEGVKAEDLWFTTCHAGDETTGFFQAVNLSCLPGEKVNGDIHKRVSLNYPGAVNPTRRDERDRECFYRIYDTQKPGYEEKEIPLFVNFVTVEYGKDLKEYFDENPEKYPLTVAIVDIVNHDSAQDVLKEYRQNYASCDHPFYIFDTVSGEERRGEEGEETENPSLPNVSVLEQFEVFCKEKNIGEDVSSIIKSKINRGVLVR